MFIDISEWLNTVIYAKVLDFVAHVKRKCKMRNEIVVRSETRGAGSPRPP